jgi:hypothetical protein
LEGKKPSTSFILNHAWLAEEDFRTLVFRAKRHFNKNDEDSTMNKCVDNLKRVKKLQNGPEILLKKFRRILKRWKKESKGFSIIMRLEFYWGKNIVPSKSSKVKIKNYLTKRKINEGLKA